MSYSTEIAKAIKNFLDTDDWHYTFDENDGIFKMGVNLKCKLGSTDMRVKVGADYFTTYAAVKMNADASCRTEVAEFITRANYGLRNGNFEMDFRDGELRYKSFNNCDGLIPSRAVIADGIMIPALMIDRYGDGLVAVMFGLQTPEDAVAASESD